MRACLSGVVAITFTAATFGQCEPGWAPGFERLAMASASPQAMVEPLHFQGDDLLLVGFGLTYFEGLYPHSPAPGPYLLNGADVRALDGGLQATAPAQHSAVVWTDPVTQEESIFVAGSFTQASGEPVVNIARWNGQHWSSVGGSTSGSGTNGVVRALAVADLGDGEHLYAGGDFTRIGGVNANRLARWNGGAWEPVGGGCSSRVRALRAFDFGDGASLVVAGDFTLINGAPAPYIARWNGQDWTPMGDGATGYATDVQIITENSGPALYATGRFQSNALVARWNGTTWTGVGLGLTGEARTVRQIALQGGPTLVALGRFTPGAQFEDICPMVAMRADGWEPVLAETSDTAADLAPMIDPATGEALYLVAMTSTYGDPVSAPYLVAHTGEQRESIGTGLLARVGSIGSLHDGLNGDDPTMYADGSIRFVDGEWRRLAFVLNRAPAESLGAAPGGGPERLFFTGPFDGYFPNYGPVTPARGVAQFDGVNWSALGEGIAGDGVALVSGNLDGVEKVYVGAMLDTDETPRPAVFSWDGESLAELPGLALNGRLNDLYMCNFEGAPTLFAAGNDLVAGRSIARWDGVSWSDADFPDSAAVEFAAVVHELEGQIVYAAGRSLFRDGVWRFDGAGWTNLRLLPKLDLHSYLIDYYDLAVFDDGEGEALYVVGDFRDLNNGGGQRPFFGRVTADGLQFIAFDEEFVAEFGASNPHDEQVTGLHPMTRGEVSEPTLLVTGDFTSVAAVGAFYVAGWRAAYALPGDINSDNIVNMADLMAAVDAFNTSTGAPTFNPDADLNQDGSVDFADLNLVVSSFHSSCP